MSVKVNDSNSPSSMCKNNISMDKSIHHNRHIEQNREEEEESYSIKEGDTQDNNSGDCDDMQGELVLKCEVSDDEIKELGSKDNCVTSDTTCSEVNVTNKVNVCVASGSHLVFEVSPIVSKLNKRPKTSAERGREHRLRRALLKQLRKQQRVPDAILEATESTRSAENSEIRAIRKRLKAAEATRRWREKIKGLDETLKKQRKTGAQRMREYRARKKLDIKEWKRIRNRDYQRAWRQRKRDLKQKVSQEEKEEKKRKRHRENQRAYYYRTKALKENDKNVQELSQKELNDFQMSASLSDCLKSDDSVI